MSEGAAHLLPTPPTSPLLPQQQDQHPKPALLSADINAATRKQHTELNRLIVDRIPLALPPYTNSSDRYATGLAAFLQIYLAFEQAWSDLATTAAATGNAIPKDSSGDFPKDSDDVFEQDFKDVLKDTRESHQLPQDLSHDAHQLRLVQYLLDLRPANLPRSARMASDAAHLRAPLAIPYQYQGQPISTHIQTLCRQKPHALLAYSWVMYMGVFSGGRWVRQQLANAGPTFWQADQHLSPEKPSHALQLPGFQFLSFPGQEDGEDIKRAFKARLADANALLSPQERRDVTDAARDLFELCISLVKDLDGVVARREARRYILPLVLAVGSGLLLLLLLLFYTTRSSAPFSFLG